ncbi:MAG: TonB-dependent receptor [Acidobacteria bacterium]|nr:TonB-dependent receptor [Acidobacteriota bacterium]
MRTAIHRAIGAGLCALALAVPASAQDFRGRINGTVTDGSGAVLPGVTVTATSPALIQPQVAVTSDDGAYRLIALPAGLYELTFELPGFRTLKRDGIRVVIGQTLSVNGQLEVATLEETVTVSGESPVVDTSTTTVGTNFTKELLTEIPNARDIWAAMAQAPGFQMNGYDVGGSHAGTQTGFIAYGISQQRTTRIEGINTTEGTDANAGYFDFGSFEEFQLGGAGNGADQDTPGASMNITVKSGGDRLTGSWYSDWQGDATIADNVPDELKTTGGTLDGFRAPSGGVRRGNRIDRQYDLNGNVGGPIYRGKAWFFYSYRLNDQYTYITGTDLLAQSKLTNQTVKGTYQLSRNNQLIGYWNKRSKLQPLRDLGLTTPLSAARYQASNNYPYKGEWTSVISDRLFLDVIVAQWLNYFPLRPTSEAGLFPEDRLVPGRLDTTTGQFFDGGANSTYQDQRRSKPQYAASMSYYQDGWRGSHDFKLGVDGRWEKRLFLADQPFNIFYRDANGRPNELELYNAPTDGDNRTTAHSVYLQDTWKFSSKLTLNLGVRGDYYRDFYPDQTVAPAGVPALAGSTDARLVAFFAKRDVPGAEVAKSFSLSPRVGFAYDLRGNGKTVLKGYFGQFAFNSAPDTLAAQQNPVGGARLRYRFTDLNGNRLLDGPQELGAFLSTQGGAGFVTIDPDLARPYSQEVSFHFEQEVYQGLSARASYVYKNIRNEWAEVDLNRVSQYTRAVTANDIGPDGLAGTSDDKTVSLLDLALPAAQIPQNRVFTNPDEGYDSDYQTVEFALNRRFKDNWMALTSFAWTQQKEYAGVAEATTSALEAARMSKSYLWNPNQRMFGRETKSIWNYKLIGRYVFPYQIGFSASYKLQSGQNWGRYASISLPNAGTQNVRLEPVNTNRTPNVGIFDFRIDKSFKMPGRFGKLTAQVDMFNATNSSVVTNFRMVTGARFQEVIALLDPRIIKVGLRYDF